MGLAAEPELAGGAAVATPLDSQAMNGQRRAVMMDGAPPGLDERFFTESAA